MAYPRTGRLVRTFLFGAFLCAIPMVGISQRVVCSDGFGSFNGTSASGVAVSVGASKESGFARRACQAKLSWDNQKMQVEPGAWQVDIDLMGVDLGLGPRVVALQIGDTEVDPLMRYEIYSLTKPPRKLRTITGGDFYRAADTDLDGQIEIWTSDAGAINGFEGLPLSALDFAPPIALRFDRQKLIDVSSEFQPQFDRKIATVRAQLDPQQLSAFKNTDGKLSSMSPLTVTELHGLVTTKIRVLEIVWCYLYSGREQEAWRALADMWPAADFDRIRQAILNARERGIRSEVDGVSGPSSASRRKKRVMIYDPLTEITGPHGGPISVVNETGGPDNKMEAFEIDTQPVPIFLRRPLPPAGVPADSLNVEVAVNLVIDSAGKVWSIKTEGKPDQDLIDASAEWKFVPGLKDGRPVACRLRLGVVPFR
jgi:hypothetical protein